MPTNPVIQLAVAVCCLAVTGTAVPQSRPSSPPELAAVAAAVPPQNPPADTAGKSPAIFSWNQLTLRPFPEGHMSSAPIFSTPTRTLEFLTAHTSRLNPGEINHPAHRHPGEDEIVMILEGTLEVYINGTTQIAGPRSVMLFMENDWHRLKNVGKETASYILFHIVPGKGGYHSSQDKAAARKSPSPSK